MEIDEMLGRLQGDLFLPLLLALVSVFVYLVALSGAYRKTRALQAIAEECRRRREEEERRLEKLGYSPRLARYRRLEAELARRLAR